MTRIISGAFLTQKEYKNLRPELRKLLNHELRGNLEFYLLPDLPGFLIATNCVTKKQLRGDGDHFKDVFLEDHPELDDNTPFYKVVIYATFNALDDSLKLRIRALFSNKLNMRSF